LKQIRTGHCQKAHFRDRRQQIHTVLAQKDVHMKTICRLAIGLEISFGRLLGLGDWQIDLEGWPTKLEDKIGPLKLRLGFSEKTGLGKSFLLRAKQNNGNCMLSSLEIICKGYNLTLQQLLESGD
jgi:hypothetical protein